MSESPKVLASFEIIDGVALIKLDDGKANALSLPMQQAFNSALEQAQRGFDATVEHVDCWLTARRKRLQVEARRQNA